MILIDSRVGSRHLVEALGSVATEIVLEFGDAMWLGNGPQGAVTCAVELKTIPDLIASLHSGRLSGHQLLGLQSYDYAYLLVEGLYKTDDSGRMLVRRGPLWEPLIVGSREVQTDELEAALHSYEVIGGLYRRNSTGRRDTARIIRALYNWWQKRWDAHRTHLTVYRPREHFHLIPPSPVQQFAAMLPGVGAIRSAAVASRFASFRSIVEADEKAWLTVPGIGKATVRKIHQWLEGETLEGETLGGETE